MKKINALHNDQDRIICKTNCGKHEFFYQPVGTREKLWLFSTAFSGSIFTYFRDCGRRMDESGFSLTLKELYKFKGYRNYKLANLMDRIPKQVEYAIKEVYRAPKKIITASFLVIDRHERSASSDDGRAA